jgi:CheY-like chemotaxis protein
MVPLLRVSNARLGGLRLDLARGLPPVAVDATQIRQIVMNLVLNAAEAIPEVGGEIVLTTGLAPVTAETLLRCAVGADRAPGDYVFLEVRDNGMGMAPEVLARIFDPFFTTKPSGRGLGLSATLGIVRAHAGALSVTSAAGAGSTFRLLLPPATGGAVMPAGIPAQSLWQWDGRVLVVDDQMQVRFVMAEMLRSFGLTPVEAADGPAAIAAYRENPESFDLVVLDLIMPNMSGEQTIAVLRSIDPRVKVLCMSGCGEDDVMRRLAATGPVPFLGKPFTRTTLERELRAILES